MDPHFSEGKLCVQLDDGGQITYLFCAKASESVGGIEFDVSPLAMVQHGNTIRCFGRFCFDFDGVCVRPDLVKATDDHILQIMKGWGASAQTDVPAWLKDCLTFCDDLLPTHEFNRMAGIFVRNFL